MGDAESRAEDYRREAWELAHEGEYDQECPSCGEFTLNLVEDVPDSRMEPGWQTWACRCGYEGQGQE